MILKHTLVAALAWIVCLESAAADNQRREAHSAQASSYRSDNTGVNKRDRSDNVRTADSQAMDKAHEEVTRQIRGMVQKQDNLSTYAKNVKIITDEKGMVYLRGPVRSAQERSAIVDIAADVAGKEKVRNELEVVPDGK